MSRMLFAAALLVIIAEMTRRQHARLEKKVEQRTAELRFQQHKLDRLFEPFFRATKSGATEGTGLGLAIAARALAMHDGTITARNVEPLMNGNSRSGAPSRSESSQL